MQAHPTELKRLDDRRLAIVWSDGETLEYDVAELRKACPCATCREKRDAPEPAGMLPVLSPEEARPLTISGMKPVGNYAYGIAFSDGHDTGIFTFDALRALGKKSEG